MSDETINNSGIAAPVVQGVVMQVNAPSEADKRSGWAFDYFQMQQLQAEVNAINGEESISLEQIDTLLLILKGWAQPVAAIPELLEHMFTPLTTGAGTGEKFIRVGAYGVTPWEPKTFAVVFA